MAARMSIRPQTKNANRHTARGMQALERSLEQDGWIGAITVAADGETFDGSARVEKTAENGMLDDAIIVESDGTRPIVVKRTDIPSASDPRAVRLGIAANRVSSLNLEWEPGVLAELAGDVDLSALFYPHELADVTQPGAEAVDPAELWKGMPDFEQDGVKTYKDLIIHFETREDYEAFAKVINRTLTPATKSLWYPDRPEALKGQTSKVIGWSHES